MKPKRKPLNLVGITILGAVVFAVSMVYWIAAFSLAWEWWMR